MLKFKTILNKILSYFHYENSLENFIRSKNPQDILEIERYTVEFNRKISKGAWYEKTY